MQTEANIDFLGATRHMHQVVAEQSSIGWGLVRYGFVSRAWRDCQQHYGQSTDPHYTSQQSERWARDLQIDHWEYVLGLWNFRNGSVHGTDKEIARQICTNRLQAEVCRIQLQNPEVGPSAVHLLQQEGVERKSQHYMRHWICNVRAAVAAEQICQSNRRTMHNVMAAICAQQQRIGGDLPCPTAPWQIRLSQHTTNIDGHPRAGVDMQGRGGSAQGL